MTFTWHLVSWVSISVHPVWYHWHETDIQQSNKLDQLKTNIFPTFQRLLTIDTNHLTSGKWREIKEIRVSMFLYCHQSWHWSNDVIDHLSSELRVSLCHHLLSAVQRISWDQLQQALFSCFHLPPSSLQQNKLHQHEKYFYSLSWDFECACRQELNQTNSSWTSHTILTKFQQRYFSCWRLSLILTLAKLSAKRTKEKILWYNKRMLSLYLMFHKYFYVCQSIFTAIISQT